MKCICPFPFAGRCMVLHDQRGEYISIESYFCFLLFLSHILYFIFHISCFMFYILYFIFYILYFIFYILYFIFYIIIFCLVFY